MLTKKTVGIAAACALALGAWSGMAAAAAVDAGGINVDPDSQLNLQIQGIQLRETSISAPGQTLQGYGVIASVNGVGPNAFCATAGCDLNFTFSYTVQSIDANNIVFSGGVLSLFVDPNGTFNQLDPSTAGVGSLWLQLTGHESQFQGFPSTGTLFSTVTGSVAQPGTNSGGFGLMDVNTSVGTGWPALLDNGIVTQGLYADGLGGFADFNLSTSFSFNDIGICAAGLCYPIAGTGQLLNQVQVPEPGALGMLGFGMGMLGLLFWRRRKEADDRA